MLHNCPEKVEEHHVPEEEREGDPGGVCLGVFVSEDKSGQCDRGDELLEFTIYADGQLIFDGDGPYYLTKDNLADIATAYRQCGFQL